MDRIEKFNRIAIDNGVTATIKENNGDYYANINSVSFRIIGYKEFDKKCKELKYYVKPEPMNLTAILSKIEDRSFMQAKRHGVI